MSDEDPWSWTVAEVSHFVRHDLARIASNLPNAILPDCDRLAMQFESAEVNGYALLSAVDHDFLRTECGITSLGKRSAVLLALNSLQHHSTGYKNRALAPFGQPKSNDNTGSTLRSNETFVEDATGRKRRKLVLTNSDSQTQTPTNRSNEGYLIAKYYPVEEVFFDSDADAAGPPAALSDDRDDSSNPREISLISSESTHHGTTQYVYRQMRHMMCSKVFKDVQHRGQPAKALFPYRKGLVRTGQHQSALVFREVDDEVLATREDVLSLEFANERDRVETVSADSLGDLIRKYPVRASDSDSDAEEDSEQQDTQNSGYSSGDYDEAEESLGEDERLDSSLPRHSVHRIVASVREETIRHWWDLKQPKLEAKRAYTVWRQTRGSGQARKALVARAKATLQRLDARLSTMELDFVAQPWRSEEELRPQCSILEPTLEDREEQRWKMSVWSRPEAPAHQISQRPRSGQQQVPQKQADAELPMNDFIIDDAAADVGADSSAPSVVNEDHKSEHDAASLGTVKGDAVQAGGASPEDKAASCPGDPVNDLEMPDTAGTLSVDISNDEGTSDDDLPPPSSVQQSRIVRLHATPRQRSHESMTLNASDRKSGTIDEVIELSSDDETKRPIPVSDDELTPSKRFKKRKKLISNQPELASLEEILEWDYASLETACDNNRLLMKLLVELEPGTKSAMKVFVLRTTNLHLAEMIQATWVHLSILKSHVAEYKLVYEVARLYSCWLNTDHLHRLQDLPLRSLNFKSDSPGNLNMFINFLKIVLPRIARMRPNADVQTISSETEDSMSDRLPPTPGSRKKKHVKRSEPGMASRRAAHARAALFEQKTSADQGALARMLPMSDHTNDKVVVNLIKDDGDPDILLHPKLARQLKAHQIDGVRFMWRETLAPDNQGCLLAHTMGLGKTAQTIALLVTIAESSSDSQTRRLIPTDLRSLHALILCPPSILSNWIQEIRSWSPMPSYFNLFTVDSGATPTDRFAQLEAWCKQGGILVISYSLFTAIMDGRSFRGPEALVARQILSEVPNIVIADEAHRLSSTKSKTAELALHVKTRRRIALTGSPLSNNTQEIYMLMSWVAPGFLGTPEEFRAHYGSPIEAGTWKDSSAYEKRKSLKKLEVLKHEIDPKYSRADHNVLKGSLPPKTEFVLFVPLTTLQEQLYTKFVEATKDTPYSQTKLFGWMHVLGTLCSHPEAFRRKLLEPNVPKPKHLQSGSVENHDRRKETSPEEPVDEASRNEHVDEQQVADSHVSAFGFNDELVKQFLDMMPEKFLVEHSRRAQIVQQIISNSLVKGDKILIFSHSIMTLDYFGAMIQTMGARFDRIDGSRSMKLRNEALQGLKNGKFQVLLISTKAGGLGLNIQDANRVILLDSTFNPQWEQQAVGRAYRLGQRKPVFVYRIICSGTFEDVQYNKTLFKTSLFSRVVDKKNSLRHAEKATKGEWLFPPKEVQQNAFNHNGGDPHVLDDIVARHDPARGYDSYIRAIERMDTLQEDADDEPLNEIERKEVEEEIAAKRRQSRKDGLLMPPTQMRQMYNNLNGH